MILFELTKSEQNPVYQGLSIDNLERQYDFLRSLINAALALRRPILSAPMIKALNAHAIACLHVSAGEYRRCEVTVGDHDPPDHFRVPDLMEDFINEVNFYWEQTDDLALAAYVLWKLNYIHPFINGNGRTARALCYYVVCVKSGGLIPGDVILPELIRRNRSEYVELLKVIDAHFEAGHGVLLEDLHKFLERLVEIQLGLAGER